MNKRILLPTDFSKNALNAVRFALDLYKTQSCDFYLLNAYQIRGYSIDTMMVPESGDSDYEAAKMESEQGFEKLMNMLWLHDDNPKHSFHTIATFNSLIYGLKSTIAKKDIDLIVMGTKGATDAKSLLFGTNAISVMEEITECPVLAIPEDCRYSALKEIVFPTDYKLAYKRRELNHLLEIAEMHKATIVVLHVGREEDLDRAQLANKEILECILENSNHEFHTLEKIKVHTGINTFIASRKSDMIAFMNRQHSYLEKILSKPLVEEIGRHYQIPILELNATN